MHRLRIDFLLPVLFGLAASPAGADELRFSTGVAQTTMIELYTSEGCSSCPPAEAYLNDFVMHPGLWERYVPIAFHVDYWNHLGWTDRFSSSNHTRRQRAYAREHRSRTVYTPAFVVNGQPVRPGRRPERTAEAMPDVGILQAHLNGYQLEVFFDPVEIGSPVNELHVAVLGMGIVSEISAGENRGRRSRHEFVALEHRSWPGDGRHWRVSLPSVNDDEAMRLALVVWVAGEDSPAPIQATGGFLR